MLFRTGAINKGTALKNRENDVFAAKKHGAEKHIFTRDYNLRYYNTIFWEESL